MDVNIMGKKSLEEKWQNNKFHTFVQSPLLEQSDGLTPRIVESRTTGRQDNVSSDQQCH